MNDIWTRVTAEPWLEPKGNVEASLAGDARKYKDPQFIVKWEVLWHVIQRYLPSDRSTPVLDLGGGSGVWTLRIAGAGHPVLFTEISLENCALARHKAESAGLTHRIEFGVANLPDLSQFASSSFPLVLAVGNPLGLCGVTEQALREVERVTRGQGILIGEVENRYRHLGHYLRTQSWTDTKRLAYEGIGRRPYAGGVMPHREFTSHEIRALLEEAGWEVLEMYPTRLVDLFLPQKYWQQAIDQTGDLSEVIELENHMRKDPDLLGCGTEIQFVARKMASS